MKIRISLCFLLLFAVPLLFCISCSKGGSKYDDLDNDQTETDKDSGETEETDSDSNPDSGDDKTDTEDQDDDSVTDTEYDGSDTVPDEENDGGNNERPDRGDTADEEADEDSTDTDSGEDNEPLPDNDIPEETGDNDPISDKDGDPLILCTGQTKCYNESTEITCPSAGQFFGQDAQYASKEGYCLKKSFEIQGDNVYDYNTELTWQKTIPDKYNGCSVNEGEVCRYSEAVSYCESLGSGWRLPTPDEFATIIDFGKTAPAVDTNFFQSPEFMDKDFWTQTVYVKNSSKIWYLDMTEGSTKLDDDEGKYVRCVKGQNQLPKAKFTIINEGDQQEVVKDSEHNLLWIKTPESGLTWSEALDHCQKLNYNGTGGWRLPNVNELASIIDYSLAVPASEFPSLPTGFFWTSTSFQNTPGNVWAIRTDKGTIELGDKTVTGKALCVK